MDKGLKDFLGSKKKKKKSKNQACWYGHAIRNGWFLEELGIKPGEVALSPMGEVWTSAWITMVRCLPPAL